MNSEERRLSEWLHSATPMPPRRLTLEDLAAYQRQQQPQSRSGARSTVTRRRWLPALAATCAVLAIAAGVVSAQLSRGSHPGTGSPKPALSRPSSAPASTTTSSTTPATAPGRVVGPWDATAVGGQAAHAVPLTATRTSLYAADGKQLLRINAATGALLASSEYPPGTGSAVIAGGTLWLVPQSDSGGALVLPGLSPATLVRAGQIRLSTSGGGGGPVVVTTDTTGDRLYIEAGGQITVVDPATRRAIAQYRAPGGPVVAMAVAPDRSRLYVTWNDEGAQLVELAVLDPASGRQVADQAHYPGGTGVGGITASAGGIWLETGEGMTNDITFHPASDLAETSGEPVAYAGGGFPVGAVVADDVVWLGGTTNLACADPTTGRVRVSSTLPTPHGDAANISSITVAGRSLFGYYRADAGPSRLLVRLTPPAQCGGRAR